jgi:hypothetical protein
VAEQAVQCGMHGRRQKAYVCSHVAWGSGLGFYTPDEPGRRNGWCEACEQVRRRCGGWTDESEAFARIVLICDLCFDAARERNAGPVRQAEPDPADGGT